MQQSLEPLHQVTELGKSALLKGKETGGLNNNKKRQRNKGINTENNNIRRTPMPIPTHSITPNPSVSSRNQTFSTHQPGDQVPVLWIHRTQRIPPLEPLSSYRKRLIPEPASLLC